MTTAPSYLTEPVRPLTERQDEVATLLGLGWENVRIAAELGIKPGSVQAHTEAIAALFHNPEKLEPQVFVRLWAGHRIWEAMRDGRFRR